MRRAGRVRCAARGGLESRYRTAAGALGAKRRRCQSVGRRPAGCVLTALGACEPAVGFGRAEQATIAVAAVGMLAEPAPAAGRHRAVWQRQAWRFTQQIALGGPVLHDRMALGGRSDRDCSIVAAGLPWPGSRAGRGLLRRRFARGFAEQRFQKLDHANSRWLRRPGSVDDIGADPDSRF